MPLSPKAKSWVALCVLGACQIATILVVVAAIVAAEKKHRASVVRDAVTEMSKQTNAAHAQKP